ARRRAPRAVAHDAGARLGRPPPGAVRLRPGAGPRGPRPPRRGVPRARDGPPPRLTPAAAAGAGRETAARWWTTATASSWPTATRSWRPRTPRDPGRTGSSTAGRRRRWPPASSSDATPAPTCRRWMTVELLRPVPIGRFEIATEVL